MNLAKVCLMAIFRVKRQSGMNAKKIKVENDEGEIIRIFDSVKEAALYYGIQPEGMTYRVKNKICKNGETVSFLEMKSSDGISDKRRRLKRYNGVFKFNENKHCKVPYEVVSGVVCITPCPYSLSPKPFVGSCGCLDCSHFKIKDQEKHIVICTGHRFLS